MSCRVPSNLPFAAPFAAGLCLLALGLAAPGVARAQDGNGLDNLGEEDDEGDDAGDDEGEDEDDGGEDDGDDIDGTMASSATDDAEDDAEERAPRPPKDGPGWKLGRPGIEPAVGAVLFPDGSGGVTGLVALGAQASLPFYQDSQETIRWGGNARAVGQVLLGPDLYNGYAARLGVFAGPSAGPARLRVGPDFFINQYVLSGVNADPFSGVGLPLTLFLTGGSAGIYGGVEPAWYISGGWPGVDWSSEDIFGFGDEFTYRVGANVSTSKLSLGLGYNHRITAFGVQRGVSVGLGF